MAVNDLEATADGYRLRHPRHTATFTPQGMQFTPRRGGLEWAWRLTAVTAGNTPLTGVTVGAVRPVHESPQGVAYPRGGLVERYQAKETAIEQQFLIPQPLPLGGADLVIAGAVQSTGAFEAAPTGWLWRAGDSAVRLGNVRVYDAQGATLPATMDVTADATRIVVDGSALAQAAYPVTIDPEIGTNDFRLSFMGRDELFDAFQPAVAYNSQDNEYLVVWYGDDNTGSLVDGELEIFGQQLNAGGAEVGTNDFRISDMGPDGWASYGAFDPAVAYNSTNNEYLVVWSGDDDTGSLVNEEFEIYGQRLNASGTEVGANDFRISDMGGDGVTDYNAFFPAVAYNSTDNQYLVVWQGDDSTSLLVNNEFEIFGQRLSATGSSLGTNDFRISDMGPNGNTAYGGYLPAVAHNSQVNEYLVVWRGTDNTAPLVAGEYEIFGQRLNATGTEVGTNDFRISDMGPNGDVNYEAYYDPAVAYNSQANEYLVVWSGDDNTGSLVDGEFEIFGQRLDASGAEAGDNDFCLSDMGPDGNTAYDASWPAVASSSADNEYLVVWQGDDDTAPLVDEESEIFGQQFSNTAPAPGGNVYLPIILKNY